MELNFDKEIDTLLRQTLRNPEALTAFETHLDADEISAFAENALPEKIKMRAMAHLADCDRCRNILASVILLNSEAEAVTVPIETATPIQEVKVSWWQSLFSFPQLAYTMGALALVLTGLTAFIVFRIANDSKEFETAKTSQSQTANSAPQTSSSVTNSTTVANADVSPLGNVSSNAVSSANTTANIVSKSENLPEETPNGGFSSNSSSLNKPLADKTPSKPLESRSTDAGTSGIEQRDISVADASGAIKNNTTDVVVSEAQNEEGKESLGRAEREKKKEVDSPKDDKKSQPAPAVKPNSPPNKTAPVAEPIEESTVLTTRNQKSAVRSVSGKNFRKDGSSWVDLDYQPTMTLQTVSRGSKEYRKLDSQLQKIGNSLTGTVIVVWKTKGYKIQ